MCGLDALRRSGLVDVSYRHIEETERQSKQGVSERASW